MEQFEYRVCAVKFSEGQINGSFRMWIVPDSLPLQEFCDAGNWELFQVVNNVAAVNANNAGVFANLAIFRRRKSREVS